MPKPPSAEVRLWRQFERIQHAYLIQDEALIKHELSQFEEIQRELIALASDTRAAIEEKDSSPRDVFAKLVSRIGDRASELVNAGLRVLVGDKAVVPVLVRSGHATTRGEARDIEVPGWPAPAQAYLVLTGGILTVDVIGVPADMTNRTYVVVETPERADIALLVAGSGGPWAELPWGDTLPTHISLLEGSAPA